MTHSSRASLSLSQSLSPGAQKPWIFDNTYIVLYGGLSQSMSGSCLVFIDFHALDSAIFKVWGDGRERDTPSYVWGMRSLYESLLSPYMEWVD